MRRMVSHQVLVLLVVLVWSNLAMAQALYWADTDGGKIRRLNLKSAQVEDVITGLSRPVGLAADLVNGKLYWSETQVATIRRSNLDGSGVEEVLGIAGAAHDIAVDPAAGLLFWIDPQVAGVGRATLDGADPTLLPTQYTPSAIDVTGSVIFMTETTPDRVARMNYDGSDFKALTDGNLGGPWEIIVDGKRSTVMVLDEDDNRISRVSYDGEEVEWDFYSAYAEGRGDLLPGGFAMDPWKRELYWTDAFDDTLRKTAVDGNGPRGSTAVAPFAGMPRRMVFVPEPGTLSVLPLAAGLWGLRRKRR